MKPEAVPGWRSGALPRPAARPPRTGRGSPPASPCAPRHLQPFNPSGGGWLGIVRLIMKAYKVQCKEACRKP